MNLYKIWRKVVINRVLQYCSSKVLWQMVFNGPIFDFSNFWRLFTLGPFLTMKTTFSGYFCKNYLCRKWTGLQEHILDVLHLHLFLRYLINTLSCTFENRLLKQLKTSSKCIKLPGLFIEFYFARNLFLYLRA